MTTATMDMERERPGSPAVTAVLYLDVAVVVLALPIVALLGAPFIGYACAAGGWVLARALGAVIDRYAKRAENPRTGLLVSIGGLFLRLWIVTFAIVAAARIGTDDDGLIAVLVIAGAFTIYLAISLLASTPGGPRPGKGRA